MKISIVTVSYNSEKTIERTLKSILNQSYSDIEYIIIDGKSQDETMKIIERYKKKFEEKKIDYKYISEKDKGIYDAMNKGIEMATGELIGIINSDDWYENNSLQIVAEEYKYNKFDIFLGDMNVISPRKSFVKKASNSFYFTTKGWTHPTMFVKKEIYEKEKYKCSSIYDDLDFILRAKKNRNKILVINKIISNFSFGGVSTNKNFSQVIRDIKIRNNIYKENKFSRLHIIDNFLIEVLKYLMQ